MGILSKFLFTGHEPDRESDIPGLVKAGALIVDVRTAKEFSEGHISGAVHIPYDEINQKIGPVEKDQPIIVYCQSGIRSAVAKERLKQAGFTEVVDAGTLRNMRTLLNLQ